MPINPVKNFTSKYTKPLQILLFLYIIGFTIGTTTHTIDIIKGGFLPYNHLELWKNIYWTSLTLLDFLAIVLVIYSLVPALILANIIMISDVLINTQFLTVFSHYKLVFQLVFCAYVVISTPFICRKYSFENHK
ncbi:MAG: hypothetical protein JXA77_06840 [Bacteroidales bacterium]|nr:hypothetical protein [Bacteroidales bacterium]MBN2819852.1 hypothetical protein [Bacteroidales bacterium]